MIKPRDDRTGTSLTDAGKLMPEGESAARDEDDAWPSDVAGIELVWHRLNREHDLRRFFQSDVHWAECDARLEPSGDIVVSHSAGRRWDERFADWIDVVAAERRGAKIDLKEGGPVLSDVLAILDVTPIGDEDLWFNCAVETIGGRPGFEALRAARPLARRSIALDTLAAWLVVAPDPCLSLLGELRTWGVERVSISVQTQMFQEVVRVLRNAGWPVNVWDVSDPAQMRDACASGPTSITADLGILTPPTEEDRSPDPLPRSGL